MLDKMLGVSPPLKGEALDAKSADSRKLRETSSSDYKRDFDKALQKKLDEKLERKKENLAEKKDGERRPQELRADNKDKKSLGGIKKKVTEDDDKMVSNVTASNESKVETPDSKIENLAKIETDIPAKVQNTENGNTEAAAAGIVAALQAQALPAATPVVTPAVKSTVLATPVVAAMGAENAVTMQAMQNQAMLEPQLATPLSAGQGAAQLQPQANLTPQSLDAELSAAVDFESQLPMQPEGQGVLQRMKAFESVKNPISEKTQSLGENVLKQLQQEQAFGAGALAGKSFAEPSGGEDLGQQDSGQMNDFKSELPQMNGLHQATGQSHAEFKTHLQAAAAPDLSLSKLEERREANIGEIMNQAQYLVKKGGGEVTVRMSPEGMGEVQLKVLLQDGKLNVELQTQDRSVKKLIEESLSDLKSGLAAHRLSLEHVKIDTVNATNADNNTQMQSNLNQGGSQGQAREFLSDFQGNMNNQSRQNSSATADGLATSSLRPVTNTIPAAQALRTYGGTKGATINRVA